MYKNIKIGARLLISFGMIVFFMLVAIAFVLNKMVVMSDTITSFYDHPFVVSNAVRDANNYIIRMHRDMKDVVLANTPEALNAAIKSVDDDEIKVYEYLQTAKERFLGDSGQVDELIEEFKAWKPIRDEVIALTKAGEKEKAESITVGKGANQVSNLLAKSSSLTSFAGSKAAEFITSAKTESSKAFTLCLALFFVVVLFTALNAILVSRSITIPLKEIVSLAEKISTGDLSSNVVLDKGRADEIGMLFGSFRIMAANLKEQMKQLVETVNYLAASSSEISASVSQLASSTAETSTSVSETSTTAEEIKQIAQVTSQKAKYVSDTARQVEQISKDGRKAVETTIESMGGIRAQMESIGESIMKLSEQSQAIGEIIAAVDDIADQTNLLAVNAAIEAAKADEHGKGFAVVAQEIRSLAEQSKQATTRVRTILNDIQKATSEAVLATEQGNKKVNAGVMQSEQAGESIQSLASSVAEAAQAGSQIAASSQQQMAGIDQVAMAMGNVKQASGQNAASTRQLEATVQKLAELGHNLKELVGHYKVD